MSTELKQHEDYVDSDEESMKDLKDDTVEAMLKDDDESMETEEQGKAPGTTEPSTMKTPSARAPAPVPPPMPPITGGPVNGAASGSGAGSAPATTGEIGGSTSSSTSTSTCSSERRNSASSSAGTGNSIILPRIYHNRRSARKSQQAVRILNGCAASPDPQVGSFLDNDTAEQISTANYIHIYSKKQNICTSFNLDTLVYNTCTGNEHPVLRREKRRIDAKDLVPAALVLSDHNFPALLPAEGDGQCLKILHIEFGTLSELVEAFLGATRGFVMPAGSVVVLASASYLAWGGTAAYIDDYLRVRGGILGVFQEGLEVAHGVPVPGCGINSTLCIRALLEVTLWLASVQGTHGRDITTFRDNFLHEFAVEKDAGCSLRRHLGAVRL
jgi:hypothetical protein